MFWLTIFINDDTLDNSDVQRLHVYAYRRAESWYCCSHQARHWTEGDRWRHLTTPSCTTPANTQSSVCRHNDFPSYSVHSRLAHLAHHMYILYHWTVDMHTILCIVTFIMVQIKMYWVVYRYVSWLVGYALIHAVPGVYKYILLVQSYYLFLWREKYKATSWPTSMHYSGLSRIYMRVFSKSPRYWSIVAPPRRMMLKLQCIQ